MNRGKEYEKLSDEQLIVLIRQGNLEMQEYIINKYKNLVKIKSRAYFIIGADKEDLVQEGMIGLFKAIRDFDSGKNVAFYYFAELCITRQIISAIKSATRKKHIPLNSYISLNKQVFKNNEDSYIDYLVDESISNPEDLFIGQEGKLFIENIINDSLSEMEIKVLDLYLQGHSYLQIGRIISKDEKSIDNAIQRIRRKISNAIK